MGLPALRSAWATTSKRQAAVPPNSWVHPGKMWVGTCTCQPAKTRGAGSRAFLATHLPRTQMLMPAGDRGGCGEDWVPHPGRRGWGRGSMDPAADKPSADRKGQWAPENRQQQERNNRVEGSSEDGVPNGEAQVRRVGFPAGVRSQHGPQGWRAGARSMPLSSCSFP